MLAQKACMRIHENQYDCRISLAGVFVEMGMWNEDSFNGHMRTMLIGTDTIVKTRILQKKKNSKNHRVLICQQIGRRVKTRRLV
jgi:hypothetical protein